MAMPSGRRSWASGRAAASSVGLGLGVGCGVAMTIGVEVTWAVGEAIAAWGASGTAADAAAALTAMAVAAEAAVTCTIPSCAWKWPSLLKRWTRSLKWSVTYS